MAGVCSAEGGFVAGQIHRAPHPWSCLPAHGGRSSSKIHCVCLVNLSWTQLKDQTTTKSWDRQDRHKWRSCKFPP